ncbi:hypothetical protein [Chromatocurvus halotolerans]|uniref:Uncharacterized protein n=1 Tax=Chromatocurvus halotolerans TaxID=1132028 RepID=A0A4R2KUZ8_9GAMM|nr:hypothetical protein [Chromatocurvus halotolerans]TCO76742.1 hypothetical protein EV688_104197 [Chromatocurvus halotolerans]
MKLPGFIPAELRELASFVPASGWDAVEWRPLLAAMRAMSLQLVTGRGVSTLSRVTGEAAGKGITLVRDLDQGVPLAEVSTSRQRKQLGNALLAFYFGQWLVDDGLFLDLRPSRFAAEGNALLYQPNGLWIQLRPEFRSGMLALYRSFYNADDAAFEAALRQMGMLRPELDDAASEELKGLLRTHFGMDQRAQHFRIEEFRESFDDLFRFFVAHDYKLHSDFVFVGFYLITLYLALEALGEPLDTRAICSRALG